MEDFEQQGVDTDQIEQGRTYEMEVRDAPRVPRGEQPRPGTAKEITDDQWLRMKHPGPAKNGKSRSGTIDVIQALGLYLDGASFDEAGEMLDFTGGAVANWSSEGRVAVDGVKFSFPQLLQAMESARARLAAKRMEQGEARFDFDSWALKGRERAAAAIEKAKRSILDNLDETNDDGDFRVRRSLADLVALEKLGMTLRGEATEITEQRRVDIRFMASAIRLELDAALRDQPELIERILRGLERKFEMYEASQGDEQVVRRLLKS